MLRGYQAFQKTGTVQATESFYLFEPLQTPSAGNYGVLLLHGAGNTDQYMGHTRWGSSGLGPSLAREGFIAAAGAMAGDAYGNDTAMARVTAHGAWLEANRTVKPGKYHLVGTSMGGYTALRWAILNPTKVASLSLLLPLCDIVTAYTNNVGGLQASMATAWGVTAPAALPAGADLLATADGILDAGIPTRFYYDDADTTIPQASVLAMAELTGGSTVEISADLGHTEAEIAQIELIGGGQWRDLIAHIVAAQAA